MKMITVCDSAFCYVFTRVYVLRPSDNGYWHGVGIPDKNIESKREYMRRKVKSRLEGSVFNTRVSELIIHYFTLVLVVKQQNH